jgi:hypothetical protein
MRLVARTYWRLRLLSSALKAIEAAAGRILLQVLDDYPWVDRAAGELGLDLAPNLMN